MKARCLDPNNIAYKWYGGRGITVCKRWLSFEKFLTDMGERPDGLTIDRRKPDGNYEPGNCRWATHAEQRRNVRCLSKRIGTKMDNKQAIEWIIQAADAIELGALKHDLAAVLHKLRYPMVDILAKVPDGTIADKARRIGVSRQTIYVWTRETARPNGEQARVISKLTGIPTAQIRADGYMEGQGDTRRKGAKTRHKLAQDGEGVSRRTKRVRAKSGRVAPKPSVGGSARTVRKRTRRRAAQAPTVNP